jgi:uncharacterized SAM-binding protein YcdF (DUF218 family)
MYISQLNFEELTRKQITNLIFTDIEDDCNTGECILVVGSKTAVHWRLPAAIELYKQGRAKKILFSGGMQFEGSELTEAALLKEEALALGVLEEDIITEEISLNTLENVLASLLVLQREFQLHNINRILVVTNSFHMKRLDMTLKTYMPSWFKFTLCPTHDGVTRKNNWHLSEKGRIRVETEAEKIIKYVKQGSIKDEKLKFTL